MNTNDNYLKAERQIWMRRLVEGQGSITVSEVSTSLGVSEATIRRDLEEMQTRGWLYRTHGGAVRVERALRQPPIRHRLKERSDEKQRIGKAAAQLIQDRETIFLGSSTTVLEVARNIPAHLKLRVITNSVPIINELADYSNIEMIVIGGTVRPSEQSFVGHFAEAMVQEFRADKVFMGMRAIDIVNGFTNDDVQESILDRKLLSIASQLVIVADHTKFGRVSTVLVGPVTAAHVIVTDTQAPPDMVDQLRQVEIEVVLA
jgi:DeoR/GlpR family transcriptional regulator of sugar metabolism